MRSSRKPLETFRYQLGVSVLLSLLIPILYRYDLDMSEHLGRSSQANTLIAGLVATAVALVILRRFLAFPGTIPVTYVLPVTTAVFAAVILLFF